MGQIILQEWNENYAISVKDELPIDDQEVFFKTESGNIVRGFYNTEFDSCQKDWDILDEAVEWHPIKIDD